MKAVNVDEVLNILHKYGNYIFVTDEQKYSSMVDEITNLKAVNQEPILDKIRVEISEEYGDYDICEWFNDYDYEENDISEYRQVGDVSDILKIIDKYRESEVQDADSD